MIAESKRAGSLPVAMRRGTEIFDARNNVICGRLPQPLKAAFRVGCARVLRALVVRCKGRRRFSHAAAIACFTLMRKRVLRSAPRASTQRCGDGERPDESYGSEKAHHDLVF